MQDSRASAEGHSVTHHSNKAIRLLKQELKRIENTLENGTASRNQVQATIERLETEVVQVKAAITILLREREQPEKTWCHQGGTGIGHRSGGPPGRCRLEID